MEIDLINDSPFEEYLIPHIAMTTYKYRAKGTAVFKAAKFDITIDQCIILKVLSMQPELTQQELAEKLYKDKSNLSRMLECLEKKGYIKRRLDIKENRAVKFLSLTNEGEQYLDKLFVYAKKLHNTATKGISKEETDTIKRVMQKIRNNLNEKVKED